MLIAAFAFAFAFANLLLTLYVLHKVRRVHLMMYDLQKQVIDIPGKHLVHLSRQMQSLDWLTETLKLKTGLPPTRGWAASPDFLQVIAQHALQHRPQSVLECSSGTSTVVLARCMQINGSGHVYSLEHDPAFASETRERLAANGLEDWATVLDAPLTSISLSGNEWAWYDVKAVPAGEFDMLVIDGPPMPVGKMVRYPAGPLLLPRLRAGGFAFVDDYIREDEQEIVRRWQQALPALLLNQHVCEKGCVSLHKPSAI